jgi:hypothetical protein
MNPWDDDIDMTVADCTALDGLWEKGDNVTERHPNLNPDLYQANNSAVVFDARLVENNLILSRGDGCCKWYKLQTVQQVRMSFGKQIIGIDIECADRWVSPRERSPKRKSGWMAHMQSNGTLDVVQFGPTTIQLMPTSILDKYIQLRYGKRSPCQFPYDSGEQEENYIGNSLANRLVVPKNNLDLYASTSRRFNIDFATSTWYIPQRQREKWRAQAGNGKQNELTHEIPNLDRVEIDNTIADEPGACDWGKGGATTLKVLGFNAERGKYWDIFGDLVNKLKDLKDPDVILLNGMDIGMARSNNVHTARRLALELGMNYAWGLEFVELTRGTEQEQNGTTGRRNALGLHGNAILTKCFIGEPMIIRDPLPRGYFATGPVGGVNANGFEIRLGGRMGELKPKYSLRRKQAFRFNED